MLITNEEDLPDTNDFSVLYDSIVWDNTLGISIPTKDEVFIKYKNIILNYPMIRLRIMRRAKLKETDYLVLSDYPHSSESVRQEWLIYRQALRDLPSTANPQLNDDCFLTNVTWPTPPENIYIEDIEDNILI